MKNTGKNTDSYKVNIKPWKPGQSGNLNGRPKGQRNYETIRREAIKLLAQEKGKTPEEIEELIVAAGMNYALTGEYNFYKDDLDRTHGKAKETLDLNQKGDITIKIVSYGN